MSVFRGKDWIRKTRIRLQSLTETIKKPRNYKETISRLNQWVKSHKVAIAKSAGAVAILIGISAGGNQYIEKHTYEIYHVYVDGKEIGVVSDPKIIDQAVQERHKQVQLANPDVHMVLDTSAIDYKSEKAYKGEYDNQAAVNKLKPLLGAKATGIQLIIDGKEVAVLRDKAEAERVLEDFKNKYGQVDQKQQQRVSVLAAEEVMAVPMDSKVLVSAEFTQDVQMVETYIEPDQVVEPGDVLALLESMGEEPQTYTVQKGDCVGCIANKFDIGLEDLYDLNPWIVDDMIRIGDVMVVKGFEPTLGVKTIEIAVEEEEIQYDTVYEKDDTLREGKTRTITPGQNGSKKMTYQLTSINGNLIKEDLLNEEVLEEPVTAVVAKGTMRVKGEGSGKFAWPVAKAKLTSSYGKRWGAQHKGIDLASSNRTIMASDAGKVVFTGTKNGYGKTVIIDHKNGYETLYGHLSKISVSEGDVVEKGDKIGVMGSTGRSTGIHLHFEIHSDGKAQNPIKFLRK